MSCLWLSALPWYFYGPEHLTRACNYRARTGDVNRGARFHLRKMVQEVYGVLGQGTRAQLLQHMERPIKSLFPNEDGADFFGFVNCNANEQMQVIIIVNSILKCLTKLLIDRLIFCRNSQLVSHNIF